MDIWVSVDKNGFLDGYSLNEQPDMIKVQVEKIPVDFTNWKLVGTKLVRDSQNAPIVEGGLTETEQLKQENEELRQRVDMSDEALLELADMVLSATEAMKGGK
ncbi:hypothetical protein JZO77_05920 [Enterococcus hulanensis]|uniref:hypothetical protein n=1 Tax=Enterococcus hulanensis TaxID=2559929 RepID=UPI001A8F3B30|nr:hypothetical protein [Enterococcus hulanensis]MBO0456274.1 hypothetical protein [Enterococcus hulanensis]